MQLSNSGVLVTGGASGLGEAVARRFAAAGARVTLADLNEARGAEVAAAIGGRFVRADVSAEDDVQAAVAAAQEHAGALHIALSCAGVAPAARVLGRDGAHPLDLFERVVRVNLIGTFNVVRLAAAAMSANPPNDEGERGVLINTASVAAFEGQIGQAAYSASKGGVAAMTLPLARELARVGVRVVTIAPGLFDTPMMAGFTDEVRASLGAQVPFPARLGRPEEYAQLAQAIVETPMLNGEVIRLDGALRMGPK